MFLYTEFSKECKYHVKRRQVLFGFIPNLTKNSSTFRNQPLPNDKANVTGSTVPNGNASEDTDDGREGGFFFIDKEFFNWEKEKSGGSQ